MPWSQHSAQSGSPADSPLQLAEFTASAGMDWLLEIKQLLLSLKKKATLTLIY